MEILFSNREIKPKSSYKDLIYHMSTKGIQFNFLTEVEAIHILKNSNYYYKLLAYKRNYGKNSFDHYINLDFSYLYDLSKIDAQLRYILIQMCLDIEHALKVKILSDITEDPEQDGYSIVDNFFNQTGITASGCMPGVGATTHYNKNLYTRYLEEPPIWVLLETMSFGTFLKFINFYTYQVTKGNKEYIVLTKVLKHVRNIRNAAAHNQAILMDIAEIKNDRTVKEVVDFIFEIKTISKNMRNNKMRNQKIHDLVSVLFIFDRTIQSNNVKKKRYKELKKLLIRIKKNKNYYEKNTGLTSAYTFFSKIVDYLVSK